MSSNDDNKQHSNSQEVVTSSAQQQSDSKTQVVSTKSENDDKSNTVPPLAPPPKPSEAQQQQPQQTPDYFGSGQGNQFSLEPNPFEQSFGNPSSGEAPNKLGGLPSVASLTSPAPLGPGGTPNWQNSLRSGPLSPAMLQGPVNNHNPGYFDQEFRNNGYPTPNESSLRTGLTPGGGGSMFPAPSPNTQALFNNLNGGQATPNTAEFQRAAAAAARKPDAPTSAANAQNMSKQEYQPAQQQGRPDAYSQNQQESDAVNSLYMLAQPNARQGANANQFAAPNQQQTQLNAANMNISQRMAAQQQQQQSPTQHRSNGAMDMSGGDDDGEDEKPSARSKGKKGSASKVGQATNGRKKTDDTPSKPPAKKRSRGDNGSIHSADGDELDSDDDDNMSIKDEAGNQLHPSGRKMTDEEKRKNFLERNRIAALKCRQRKKQWLANLQTKVEIFTQENDALTTQCGQLREEIINLKTLLLAHKDCPVSHQQGLSGQNMAQFMGNMDGGGSAFGMVGQGNMHMPHMGGQGMAQSQGVQRG